MTTKAELRRRIVAARRFHDAAIRSLDGQWRALLKRLENTPDAERGAVIGAAERDLAHLLAMPGDPAP